MEVPHISRGYIEPACLKNTLSGSTINTDAAENYAALMAAVNTTKTYELTLRISQPFTLAQSVFLDGTYSGITLEMRDDPSVACNWVGNTTDSPFEITAPMHFVNWVIDMQRP